MKDLSEKERKIAQHLIIDDGFEKACEAMGFFVKENVTFAKTVIEGTEEMRFHTDVQKRTEHTHFTLLSTELIGEIKGACYLLFTHEETMELLNVVLPKSILNDQSKMLTMRDAILLEIDNIISASVITHFSNKLGFKMYGGVPQLRFVNMDELNNIITASLVPDEVLMGFKACFQTSKKGFAPEFIWSLAPEFYQGIVKYTNVLETLAKEAL